MTLSQAVQNWLLQPILTILTTMEAKMSQASDLITSLVTQVTSLATQQQQTDTDIKTILAALQTTITNLQNNAFTAADITNLQSIQATLTGIVGEETAIDTAAKGA